MRTSLAFVLLSLLSACSLHPTTDRCVDVRAKPYRMVVKEMPVSELEGYTTGLVPCANRSVNFGLQTRLDVTDSILLGDLTLKSKLRDLQGDKDSIVLIDGPVEVMPFNEKDGYQLVLTRIDAAQLTRRAN